ncbi:MAG: class II aldolase [Betaproteobacteria bacterium]|nr:MAG: class II aldolase [Betaproteobacteria bacterium]
MDDVRLAVAECSAATVRERLNRGASGNVSVRHGAGFLITPSGVASDQVRADQVVQVAMDGAFEGALKPSSEWRFHRDIYAARPEVGAVVHVHSTFATSLACLRRGIPAFHYMVLAAGGVDIRCADYATFGTQALSDAVLLALHERRACLMANHGQVAVGRDLNHALGLAVEVESLSEQFWNASLLGQPVLLTETEMTAAAAQFKGYGQQG